MDIQTPISDPTLVGPPQPFLPAHELSTPLQAPYFMWLPVPSVENPNPSRPWCPRPQREHASDNAVPAWNSLFVVPLAIWAQLMTFSSNCSPTTPQVEPFQLLPICLCHKH